MALPQAAGAQSSSPASNIPVIGVPLPPLLATEPAGPQPAAAQSGISAQATAAPPTSLSVPVTLPQPFEAAISSIAALTTGAGAALKTYRSDARTMAIRLALARALVAAKVNTPITLSADGSLAEDAMLCGPRQSYITNSVYLNYLNSLIQNINTVSMRAAAPTDIPSALKLLLATTNYSIADKVKIDAGTLSELAAKTKVNCEGDLSTYAKDYYGLVPGAAIGPAAAAAGGGGAVTTFAFLGPIGTLVDTFLSILQPILIDWATLADEARRQQAIIYALSNKDIQSKVTTTGSALATALDAFSDSSRHAATGAFVEQLVSMRETKIDLTDDCKTLSTASQKNGVPNPTFVQCFSVAWSKIQKDVANLSTLGDKYDTLADANTVSGKILFDRIMKDWVAIQQAMANGGAAIYTQSFLSDLTQFITFAQAVAAASSSSNLTALNKAAAAVAK